MKWIAPIVLLLCCSLPVYSQAPIDYNDVGVIINTNDSTSIIIGEYFAAERNVPSANMIYVDAPAKETITFEEFQTVRTQIETYLQAEGLTDKLNYLVTTKGVPLRVNWGDVNDPQLQTKSASFDSELMLILGQLAQYIGQATLVNAQGQLLVHQYFRKNEVFKRANYGMYLVTRLTALTRERVIEMIDRSGPYTFVDKDSALFVLDQDPTRSAGGYVQYNNNMVPASTYLESQGWNVYLNTDTVYVTDQRNVIGYVSWGSNDNHDHLYATKSRPRNHWLPGSIAETYVSTGGRNFQPGQEAGQSRIADLFEEGCAASSGYVFEPYTLALAWVDVLFPRYVSGHYLADSYYMSMPTFSWMAIVVGDPKSTIITEIPEPPAPSFPAPVSVCQYDAIELKPENLVEGNVYWFNGDLATVQSQGPPFDAGHPAFVAADSVFSPPTNTQGDFAYTVHIENFVGSGFADVELTVLPGFLAGFTVSADSVILSESNTVQFTDTTDGASSWLWDFGDNQGTSTEKSPTHSYTQPGKYTVECTVSNGTCSKQVVKTLVVALERSRVEISATDLDFGEVAIPENTDRSLTISNIRQQSLFVQQLLINGPHAGDFSITDATAPFTISGGTNRTFTVRFAPSGEGTRSATLQIVHNDRRTPDIVRFTGEGTNLSSAGDVPTPTEFALFQNYPNPFNPATSISFEVPVAMQLQISVFDVYGKHIETLVDDRIEAGRHRIHWNAEGYPAGTYIYRMVTESKTYSRTMILLK